ncbi:MAG: hypothetical protein WDZ84_05020 [Rhodovibrionaceae bacterium]
MTEEIRFGILLVGGVQTVEELQAILPSSWNYHHKGVDERGRPVAYVVAEATNDATKEALEQELKAKLADRDMDCWEW